MTQIATQVVRSKIQPEAETSGFKQSRVLASHFYPPLRHQHPAMIPSLRFPLSFSGLGRDREWINRFQYQAASLLEVTRAGCFLKAFHCYNISLKLLLQDSLDTKSLQFPIFWPKKSFLNQLVVHMPPTFG